jgi:hypothetical protein
MTVQAGQVLIGADQPGLAREVMRIGGPGGIFDFSYRGLRFDASHAQEVATRSDPPKTLRFANEEQPLKVAGIAVPDLASLAMAAGKTGRLPEDPDSLRLLNNLGQALTAGFCNLDRMSNISLLDKEKVWAMAAYEDVMVRGWNAGGAVTSGDSQADAMSAMVARIARGDAGDMIQAGRERAETLRVMNLRSRIRNSHHSISRWWHNEDPITSQLFSDPDTGEEVPVLVLYNTGERNIIMAFRQRIQDLDAATMLIHGVGNAAGARQEIQVTGNSIVGRTNSGRDVGDFQRVLAFLSKPLDDAVGRR